MPRRIAHINKHAGPPPAHLPYPNDSRVGYRLDDAGRCDWCGKRLDCCECDDDDCDD